MQLANMRIHLSTLQMVTISLSLLSDLTAAAAVVVVVVVAAAAAVAAPVLVVVVVPKTVASMLDLEGCADVSSCHLAVCCPATAPGCTSLRKTTAAISRYTPFPHTDNNGGHSNGTLSLVTAKTQSAYQKDAKWDATTH